MGGVGDRSPPESSTGIYTYEAPWEIYAMNWSYNTHRLAIASHLDGYPNRVEIVQLDDYADEIRSVPNLSFDHHYPPTKAMFVPDLLATSADFLRLWRVSGDRTELAAVLDGNKGGEFCGPITSFDWDEADPTRICTASIDTTCTVWDAERAAVDTQLVAHDGEVYDVAWGWPEVFASVSGDGSLRIFDLRDKEHSTILYQSSSETPVRLGWNRLNPRHIATIFMESAKVAVFDVRSPMLPIVEVQHHRNKQAGINAIAWAPHSSCHICTAGEDSQALIWDLSYSVGGGVGQQAAASGADGGLEPILAYTAGAGIEQLQWSLSQPDWVAIAFSNKLQILRV